MVQTSLVQTSVVQTSIAQTSLRQTSVAHTSVVQTSAHSSETFPGMRVHSRRMCNGWRAQKYTASLQETVRTAVKVKSEKAKESFFLCVLYTCAVKATHSIGVRGEIYSQSPNIEAIILLVSSSICR